MFLCTQAGPVETTYMLLNRENMSREHSRPICYPLKLHTTSGMMMQPYSTDGLSLGRGYTLVSRRSGSTFCSVALALDTAALFFDSVATSLG
jgi:hypothetical protein